MKNTKRKAVVAWSSGKDSAYAFHKAKQSGEFDIVGVITTITETFNRVSMHGVREELLDCQYDQIGLPATKVYIPSPCTNEIYEQKMDVALKGLRKQGVTYVIFGDLFLEDIRQYREAQMEKADMKCVFPLWQMNTTTLAHEMIASGLQTILTCIDPKKMDQSFAGRSFGSDLLRDLPTSVDPCGENGEFHSVVVAGPMFKGTIPVKVGEVVERDGFVFADVLLREPKGVKQ